MTIALIIILVIIAFLYIFIEPQQYYWMYKGLKLFKANEYESAVKAFDKVLGFTPRNAGIWNYKGIALMRLNQYEDALIAYDRALEINPSNSIVWLNKATLLLRHLNRIEESIKAYSKYIELLPNQADAFYNRACAYALTNNQEQALSDLAKAIELNPQYKLIAQSSPDFQWLRDDTDFKALTK